MPYRTNSAARSLSLSVTPIMLRAFARTAIACSLRTAKLPCSTSYNNASEQTIYARPCSQYEMRPKNSFRFENYPDLILRIQRSLNGAKVEVYLHATIIAPSKRRVAELVKDWPLQKGPLASRDAETVDRTTRRALYGRVLSPSITEALEQPFQDLRIAVDGDQRAR